MGQPDTGRRHARQRAWSGRGAPWPRRAGADGAGQHHCSCAVPAVKQAPPGCHYEFCGRGADCFQGGGQCPAQQGGMARGSSRRRPGHGHRFPPPGAADGARLFVAAPVSACNLHPLRPTALACQVRGHDLGASHAHHCASGALLRHLRSGSPSTPVTPADGVEHQHAAAGPKEPNQEPTATGSEPRMATPSQHRRWQTALQATPSTAQRSGARALQARGHWFETSCAHQAKCL